MSRVFLFNPENDLALAHGAGKYTAPPNAMALHRAGEMLPVWCASSGDFVVAPHCDKKWLDDIRRLMDIEVVPYSADSSDVLSEAVPWGWSHDACRQLVAAGVPEKLLPQTDVIEILRRLSHRKISLSVMERLGEKLPFPIPPKPLMAHSSSEVLDFRGAYSGCYVKSPWSSSGRGVFDASLMSASELSRRCDGIIRRQGAVMCEVPLDKVDDFAMLFYCDGTNVRHIGYSAFFTEHSAAYSGNIVSPDSKILHHLSRFVDVSHLKQIADVMPGILAELVVPHYKGYIGVDMLVYKGDCGEMFVAPCVEVNLRMTMGIVAWHFCSRFLAEGSSAIMRVEYGKCSASGAKAVIDSGRLVRGTLSLIPPDRNFSITVDAVN